MRWWGDFVGHSYESHRNEDWEKFGSMEDDFDYYDDERKRKIWRMRSIRLLIRIRSRGEKGEFDINIIVRAWGLGGFCIGAREGHIEIVRLKTINFKM